MPDSPTPSASRLPPARWLDARLLIGLLLVCVSVLVGARLLGSAGDGTAVWVAARDLPVGATVGAGDLRAVTVRLGEAGAYLAVTSPATGYQVVREVASGELVPRAALADPGAVPVRRVVISVEAGSAAGLRRGSRVDVYADEPVPAGSAPTAPPRLVLASVAVDAVDEGSAGFGPSGGRRAVALLVSPEQVPALLAAAGAGAHLVELPAGTVAAR